jgi:ubiquinone/menaquinone biosynthesis C-methylase UbiE
MDGDAPVEGSCKRKVTRTPEPELMLGEDQATAYAAADLSELHEPMLRRFRERLGNLECAHLLDLGCGTADMTIRFATAFPDLSALGLDGSEAMLARGRQAIRAAKLEARIILERRYLPDSSIKAACFDAVIANSLLHHLADPAVLWQTVRSCAKPGAAAMVMDLRRPRDLASAERLVAVHASEASPVLRQDFLNSLCAAYGAAEIREQLDEAGLAHFQVEEVGELHVIAWGRT